ncbi:MAG TPA: FkbM family methyltransferase, partial [Chroococcales cyanobacterium]
MPSTFVERIKHVKDRILTLLDAIKEEQSEFKHLVNTRLGAIHETKDQQHDETTALLAKIQKQLSTLMPVSDRFSYPDNVEEYRRNNPEIVLLQHLRAFLPELTALDIGANIGDVSEQLLAAGYKVIAFEPMPKAYEALTRRLSSSQSFKALPFAVGSEDKTAQLHSVAVSEAS